MEALERMIHEELPQLLKLTTEEAASAEAASMAQLGTGASPFAVMKVDGKSERTVYQEFPGWDAGEIRSKTGRDFPWKCGLNGIYSWLMLAKLVQRSPISLWFLGEISIVNGILDQLLTWGGATLQGCLGLGRRHLVVGGLGWRWVEDGLMVENDEVSGMIEIRLKVWNFEHIWLSYDSYLLRFEQRWGAMWGCVVV